MNGFEFAINLEQVGADFYREQAQMDIDESLKTVFLMLSKDEENHIRILTNWFNKISYDIKDNETLSISKDIFKDIIQVFKSEENDVHNQLELYRKALENERKSVELYEKFLIEATDEKSKYLFEFLVKQEEDHFSIIEEIIMLVNRPNDWVEAAEFGAREEY